MCRCEYGLALDLKTALSLKPELGKRCLCRFCQHVCLVIAEPWVETNGKAADISSRNKIVFCIRMLFDLNSPVLIVLCLGTDGSLAELRRKLWVPQGVVPAGRQVPFSLSSAFRARGRAIEWEEYPLWTWQIAAKHQILR